MVFHDVTSFATNVINCASHLRILDLKVVIITDLEQKQKSASNAENTTDLLKKLQASALCS